MDADKVATSFDLYDIGFANNFFSAVYAEACLHLTSISGVQKLVYMQMSSLFGQ